MKTPKILNVAFLLMLATLAACQHENTPIDQSAKLQESTGLAGSWEWVRTDGGFAYHIHDTPASTGKTISMTLTSDLHYTISINNVQTWDGTYTVEEKGDGENAQTWINFSDDAVQDMVINHVDATLLELSDNFADGVASQYKRKSTPAEED